jgi:hypothetical protein
MKEPQMKRNLASIFLALMVTSPVDAQSLTYDEARVLAPICRARGYLTENAVYVAAGKYGTPTDAEIKGYDHTQANEQIEYKCMALLFDLPSTFDVSLAIEVADSELSPTAPSGKQDEARAATTSAYTQLAIMNWCFARGKLDEMGMSYMTMLVAKDLMTSAENLASDFDQQGALDYSKKTVLDNTGLAEIRCDSVNAEADRGLEQMMDIIAKMGVVE